VDSLKRSGDHIGAVGKHLKTMMKGAP
jgi:hypothetical protein